MSLFQADTTMKTKSVNDNKGKHGPGEVLCCPIGTKKAKHMKQQAEMFDRGVKKFGILSTASMDGEESVDSCAAVPSSNRILSKVQKSFWSCTHVNSFQKYTGYINLHILLNILSKAT